MSSQSILVPTDLTEASDKAVAYAKVLAKMFSLPITLLHVVEVAGVEDTVARKYMANNFINREIKKQLEAIADQALKEDNIQVNAQMVEGNIFDAIGKCAVDINAKFLVLGTHGVKGVQHITGAFISKVIQNCNAPALIVQKDSPDPPMKTFVLPCNVLDAKFDADDLKLKILKNSGGKLHILFPSDKEEFLFYNSALNETELSLDYKAAGIDFVFERIADWSGSNYSDRLIEYSDKVKTSLIFIKRKGNMISKEDEQTITNHLHIPVFIS